MSKQEHRDLIEELNAAKAAPGTKSRRQYYILGKYDVLSVGGVDKVIRKVADDGGSRRQIHSGGGNVSR